MDSNTIEDEASSRQTITSSYSANSLGLLEDVRALWYEVCGLSHDRLQLAALETQQAGLSLVNMIMVGVLVAGLIFGAWLGFMAAVILTLIENGVTVRSAILFAVVLILLLALVLCVVIRRKSRFLKFSATLHSLKPVSPVNQTTEKP